MHRQSKQLPPGLTYEGTLLITIGTTEADEAYVIGKRGQYTPVGAYLAGDEIIKIALQHGVQMIHPGMNSRHFHYNSV
jgi:pyruvate carboxylase